MADLQTNLTVPIKTPLTDASGNLSLPWVKFFQSLVGAVTGASEAISSAGLPLDLSGDVRGASQLHDAGAIPMVESPGVLGESAIADNGSEVGITGRNVGIGTDTAAYPLEIESGSQASQVHISDTNADSGMYLTTTGPNSAVFSGGAAYNGTNWIAKSTVAVIVGFGTLGMSIYMNTGLTAGNSFTPTLLAFFDGTGAGFGGNSSPGYPVDATGDINTSTRYRVAGTQVVGAQQAAISAPSGGTTIDSEARTAIDSILTLLSTHGLMA
jgi:hypothetical protein